MASFSHREFQGTFQNTASQDSSSKYYFKWRFEIILKKKIRWKMHDSGIIRARKFGKTSEFTPTMLFYSRKFFSACYLILRVLRSAINPNAYRRISQLRRSIHKHKIPYSNVIWFSPNRRAKGKLWLI